MHKISVSCHCENLKKIRNFLHEVFAGSCLSNNDSKDFVLAVDEVCHNIFEHNYQLNPERSLEVQVLSSKTDIQVIICDETEGFDIMQYECPSIENIVQQKKGGSMGLRLVRGLSDQVQFYRKSGRAFYVLTKNSSHCPPNTRAI